MNQYHIEILKNVSKLNKCNLLKNIKTIEDLNNPNSLKNIKKNYTSKPIKKSYNNLVLDTKKILNDFKTQITNIQTHQLYTSFACINKEDFNIYYKFIKESEKLLERVEKKYPEFETTPNNSLTINNNEDNINEYLLSYNYVVSNHENLQVKNNDLIYEISNIIVSIYGVFLIEPLKINEKCTLIIENNSFIKIYDNGENEIYYPPIDNICQKTKIIENLINKTFLDYYPNEQYFNINPLIVIPNKNVIIQNNTTTPILKVNDIYYYISSKFFSVDKYFLENINKILHSFKEQDNDSIIENDFDLFFEEVDVLNKVYYLLQILLNPEKQVVFNFSDCETINSINEIKGLKQYLLEAKKTTN